MIVEKEAFLSRCQGNGNMLKYDVKKISLEGHRWRLYQTKETFPATEVFDEPEQIEIA